MSRMPLRLEKEPPTIVILLSTYRRVAATRPELVPAFDRLLEVAVAKMEAAALPPIAARRGASAAPSSTTHQPAGQQPLRGSSVVTVLGDEVLSAKASALEELRRFQPAGVPHQLEPWPVDDPSPSLTLLFEKRVRSKRGGGCWREALVGGLPVVVHVPVPRVRAWTRATILEVMAIARAELKARGAKGRFTRSVKLDDAWKVSQIDLAVGVGDLRATATIDAGTDRYEVPHEVLYFLGALDPHDHWPDSMIEAVKHAHERDVERAREALAGVRT